MLEQKICTPRDQLDIEKSVDGLIGDIQTLQYSMETLANKMSPILTSIPIKDVGGMSIQPSPEISDLSGRVVGARACAQGLIEKVTELLVRL